ncbi:hypothetical protein J2T13_004964 [Paenibacillus sp. DS2015]|uniref:glycoside hydrolase family 73 protein n=1 Tax=Paenibacillus sp. DS2015 TaxID=3373917 RepID=UPI003D1C8A8E
MTNTEFIKKIATYAIADFKSTGVPASLTIAQAALESAWGGSGLTTKANNLFGIKGKGSAGSCTMSTTEYVNGKPIKVDAAFRAYNNWGESILDHSKLILGGVSWNRNLYAKVLNKDGKTAAKEVAAAGYATDPKYADKLIAIMDAHNLYQYDVKNVPPVTVVPDKKGDEDVSEVVELKNTVKLQEERIVALERRLNISGKETYVSGYLEAVEAAKKAGAITTSADKSKMELNMIQMLHNLSLFNKGGK